MSYLWFSSLSFFLTVTMTFYVWNHRKTAEAKLFFSLLLCIIAMIAFQAFELLSTNLQVMLVFANLFYLTIQYAPVLFLLITLKITGNTHWKQYPLIMAILLLVPLATQILLWTNDLHQLMRRDVGIKDIGSFLVISKTYGPAFWVFALFNFLLTFFSLVMLLSAARSRNTLLRGQAVLMCIGLLFPLTATLLTVFNILKLGFDLTPAVFGLSAVFIAWGIYRYRLFDAVPIAHSAVIKNMNTGIIVFDANNNIVDSNPAADELFSTMQASLTGKTAGEILAAYPNILKMYQEKDQKHCELYIEQEESVKYFEAAVSHLTGSRNEHLGTLMTLHDITERKLAEETIRRMSLHDHLTGLVNRKFFLELAQHEINHAGRNGLSVGTAFIDLDDLKTINDTWGHDFGDIYLAETAKRLQQTLRETDTVSRLGGDEFAVLLSDITDYRDLEIIAEKILASFSEAVSSQREVLSIRASIGLSAFPYDADTIDELLKKADEAMYTAKRAGKNRYAIYQKDVQRNTIEN